MRKFGTMAGIGMLSVLLGIPAFVQAQDEEKPPRQQEEKPQKPEQKQQQEEMKPPKHQDKERPEDARQQERADHNGARPAEGKSAHIPDNKFHSHFGRNHRFVVQRPVVVEGQPGFVYGGYSFVFVDPWPAGWAYTDDCYVDYIDGDYFLFDLLHPGVRVALLVVM